MSYFDKIITPTSPENKTLTKTTGSYFDKIQLPKDQERANKIFGYQGEDIKNKENVRKLNSFGGIVKGTVQEVGSKFKEAGKVAKDILVSSYDANKFKTDIQEGAKDYAKGIQTGNVALGTKGLLKSGARVSGDFATAVFAPISAVLGGILSLTGGQKLIDKAGQTIADGSGITDVKAFQKFAMEHPNAGADFERLLNLGLLGKAGKTKIDPKALAKETKTFVEKITSQAQVIRETPQKVATPEPVEQGTYFDRIKTPNETPQNFDPTVSRTSQKVVTQAIEEGILKEFPEMSKVNRMVLENEQAKAQDLITNDRLSALEQIKSTETPEVQKGAIFTELKRQAIEQADVNTMLKLAKTNIGTEAAQALKAFDDGFRLEADPVNAIKELRNNRVAVVEKKQGITVDKIIKKEKAQYREEKIKTSDWSTFINELEC